MAKERLDLLLVRRGLASTRTLAQALIMEGRVTLDGRPADKPGTRVDVEADVAVTGSTRPFVSRGGVKLAGALDAFSLDVKGLTALDIGAGTGGFTDCLLKRGASRVYALDVGHGQLDHALRLDPRVTVIERLNARYLTPGDLPGLADLAVMDVSFISATLVLPAVPALLRGGDVIVLVKPQFEVGRADVGRGGIVRDPALWRGAMISVGRAALAAGMKPRGVAASPIPGAEGNREFLLHLTLIPPEVKGAPAIDFDTLVDAAIVAARSS